MDYFEKRDIKNKISMMSGDYLAEFLSKQLSVHQLSQLMSIDSETNYKGNSLDEYILCKIPWLGPYIKELSLMKEEYNDFLPVDKIPCKFPNNIKYTDNMYFTFLPNCQVEARYRLPEYVTKIYYREDRSWYIKNNHKVKYRQQVLIGYKIVNGHYYFFLRGYGNKEFNRYAVSIYHPDQNILWLTPDYNEVLAKYKTIIDDPKLTDVKKAIDDVIAGKHPETMEDEQHDDYKRCFSQYSISKMDEQYIVFLNLIYYLVCAEDNGRYSRQVTKIGFDLVAGGKTIKEARIEQDKFQLKMFEKLADNEIDEMINDYNSLYQVFDDSDCVMSTSILNVLRKKEEPDLRMIYSRLHFRNNNMWAGEYKPKDSTFEEMIVAIRDTFYNILVHKKKFFK